MENVVERKGQDLSPPTVMVMSRFRFLFRSQQSDGMTVFATTVSGRCSIHTHGRYGARELCLSGGSCETSVAGITLSTQSMISGR
jgi:hypothetical protein